MCATLRPPPPPSAASASEGRRGGRAALGAPLPFMAPPALALALPLALALALALPLALSACRAPERGPESVTEERCGGDQDCLGAWWPGAESCGPITRCEEGLCAAPPALSGDEGSLHALPAALSWAGAPPEGLGERTSLWLEWAASDLELSRGLMCREGGAAGWALALLFPRPSGGEGDPRGEWALTSAHSPAPLLALAFSDAGALLGAALLTRGRGAPAPAAPAAARWALPRGSVTVLELTPSVGEPLWGALTRCCEGLLSPPSGSPDHFTDLRGAPLESLPETLYPAAPRAHLAP